MQWLSNYEPSSNQAVDSNIILQMTQSDKAVKIMSGFIYRGIHSSKFGCYYIPDALNRGSDMAAFDVEDLDAGYQDGGLHVCTRVKTRDFVLDCYFEGITIQMREG